MRILVTGARGRVGRRLTDVLLDDGHTVVGLDLAPPTLATTGNLISIQAPLEDATAVAAAAGGVDAVIHLGALMSWVEADAAKVFSANVTGTFNLLEAVARQPLQRFIFASSGEVYPEGKAQYLPVDEHHPRQPASHYGMSKLLGEEMVDFYRRRYGLPTTILRFSHTQDASELLDPESFFSGPRFFLRSKIRSLQARGDQAALAVLQPLDNGHEQLVLSRGEDGTPYMMGICETRDLIQGIVLALHTPSAVGETMGIGADEPVCFEDAIAKMHDATGLPVVDARLPGPPVHYVTSNTKARWLLGFRPEWDFDRMIDEAAVSWHERKGTS
ncbi:MAG TPA: NAD(P)-dependent oxidoreductase [Thermomicrobiales bacterium]|nr:NAD(P)-dependent oxidoreductase [Thermomicrobiales bacterium]